MKVAFASTDGKKINLGFEETNNFKIWEIAPDQATRCGSIGAIDSSNSRDERISARAAAVAGCSIVCTMDISTGALAKVVARKVFHLRTGAETSIAEIIDKVQMVMRDNPPPWLKKAMGVTSGNGASALKPDAPATRDAEHGTHRR